MILPSFSNTTLTLDVFHKIAEEKKVAPAKA